MIPGISLLLSNHLPSTIAIYGLDHSPPELSKHTFTSFSKQPPQSTPEMASPSLPPTMHAWLRQRRGPARTSLELATSYPTPSLPSASSVEVLIRVSHVALQFSIHPRARVHRHRGSRRLRGLVRRARGRDARGGVPEYPGYGGIWPGRAGGVCAGSEQPGGAAAGGVSHGGYGRRAWEWVDGAQDGAHGRGERGASRAC